MVGPQGFVDGAAAAGELGRVEHHAAETLAGLDQRLERLETRRRTGIARC